MAAYDIWGQYPIMESDGLPTGILRRLTNMTVRQSYRDATKTRQKLAI